MTTIINAVRNILSDRFWFLKIICLAYPLYSIITSKNVSHDILSSDNMVLFAILAAAYIGFGAFMMSKNINNKSPIMPSLLTLPEYTIKTIVGTLLSAPFVILIVFGIFKINEMFTYDWYILIFFYLALFILVAPLLFIPLTFYCVKDKITDAFRIKDLLESSGNFVISILAFLIQYAATVGALWFLLYQLSVSMLINDVLQQVINSVFVVISFLVLYSYISDDYGNNIKNIYPNDQMYF